MKKPGEPLYPDDQVPEPQHNGRGALSNASSRYDDEKKIRTTDGWDIEDELPPLRTTLTRDATRTILARNTSPDVPFDRSINPYRGCEHGCIYCFARPTHANMGLSAGLDFESKLFVKPDTNPEVPLNARSEIRLQDPRGPIFEFQLDAQGKVTGAVLEQGTQKIPLERK